MQKTKNNKQIKMEQEIVEHLIPALIAAAFALSIMKQERASKAV
ncbi:hypothetical protein [Methanosarcina barkeri]|nr:hypothetical protein [Methanosarcina barkeri]